MTKVIWKTDGKTTYSLNEIADAVYHNTSSKETTYRKNITVGIAAQYGYSLDNLLKHVDTSKMFTICNDKLTAQEIKDKMLGDYNRALENYKAMLSPVHDMYHDLHHKMGVIHNTMNCNRWANGKSLTL